MFTSFLSLIVSIIFTPSFLGELPSAYAAVSDNVSGYAWSPNIGWISFNCTDASPACSGTNYGVSVSAGAVTRTLSGYAWSSNIGWITFNAADMANTEPGCDSIGYPPCNPTATMTVADGKITGWARACTVYASGCSGALKSDTDLGGWRGWISLSDSLNYGVLANGTDWTGFAWGGGSGFGTEGSTAVPGWVSFRGITTAVTPSVYGVVGTGNAIGPRSISCGVTPGSVPTNGSGTWTISVNTTQLPGPYSYTWYGTDFLAGLSSPALAGSPVATASFSRTYSATGVKTGWVVVTAGTPGVSYFVNCDGSTVTAGIDTGEPAISVGTFNLAGAAAVDPGDTGIVGTSMTLTAQITNLGDVVNTPFHIRFEVDSSVDGLGGDVDYGVPGVSPIPGADIATIGAGATVNATASWIPPVAATYRIRVCVDQDANIGSGDTGVITETNETDNCGAWSTVTTQFIVNEAEWNLDAVNNPTISAGPYKAGVTTVTLSGGIKCYDGAGSDEDCNSSIIAETFENAFIIDITKATQWLTPSRDPSASDAGVVSPFFWVRSTPSATNFNPIPLDTGNLSVSASWLIPSSACPYGSGTCTGHLKLCADQTTAPPSGFFGPEGTIREPSIGEPGTYSDNNCSNSWVTFNITEADPPPPSGGTCRAVPSVTAPNKSVTWQIDAGSISGGLPPFTYNWESLSVGAGDTFIAPTNGATESHTYTLGGTKRARVTVTDATGGANPPLVITCQGYARVQVLEES